MFIPHPTTKGSFFEFYKIIRRLTHPENPAHAFHVVVPSLPGYGFSEAPKKSGFGVFEMAKTFHSLMQALGYATYFCQGGDWGSLITKALAMVAPKSCLAVHLNMCVATPPRPFASLGNIPHLVLLGLAPSLVLSVEEQEGLKRMLYFVKNESAYQHIQSTKV